VTYLLDVNVLIAAIWSTHESHIHANEWLQGRELATCAITELGFLRISTHPRALNSDMASARKLLESFLHQNSVKFLPIDLPALQSRAPNSDSVTDLFLAEFAHSKGCRFATLDRRIRHSAIEVI